jgi:type IV fimbrial biogenesis protein FimT
MHALMRRLRRSQRGFSLTELAVVMAIVAILLAIGVPNYRYITNSYRMSAEVNGLLGDLQFARGEAIKEGQTVTACVSRDGATCDAGSTTWQEGWLVFQDLNNDQTVDPGDTVLHVQQPFSGTDTFISSNGVSAVTFNREGFAVAAGGFGGTTLTLHETSANAAWTRCLYVSAVGLMATETPTSLALNAPPGSCT